MFNYQSSPVINNAVFNNNTATKGGGAMAGAESYPKITRTIFSGNTAGENGGAVYSTASTFSLFNNTVFSGNTAGKNGGAMWNDNSTPTIIGTVFTGNIASSGGAMWNGGRGAHIINTIFADNTLNSAILGKGPDIAMNSSGVTIAGSVLGIGLESPTNGVVGTGISRFYHSASLSKDPVNLTGNATLTVNGMDFTYPTIQAGSSAINLGLYVQRNGGTYYYSEDNATWYTGFNTEGNFSGDSVTPPADAEDMTARDITGKARTGRPDAGVNEL